MKGTFRAVFLLLVWNERDGDVAIKKVRLPWDVANDSKSEGFKESFEAIAGNGELPEDIKDGIIRNEEQLRRFVELCDTDEADYAVVKFGQRGPDMITSGTAYYRPGIEDPAESPDDEIQFYGKVLQMTEDADPEHPHYFRSVDAMVRYLKSELNYDFPNDEDDRMALERLKSGQDWSEASVSYRWVEVGQ